MGLDKDLAREQRAFLRRGREGWDDHLEAIRAFLGDGLRAAGGRPALILGAGSGLEVPWSLAPRGTTGWDADPGSRLRTFLRHGRWAPWVFEDLTGGMASLSETALRGARQTWSGRVRSPSVGAARVAGLLPGLHPGAEPLRKWLTRHRPETILAANLMGQFGAVAQRSVEAAFGGVSPWGTDPEAGDPLGEAVDGWTLRALRAFLGVLGDSGADLWLCHDRGVILPPIPSGLHLGPLSEPWTAQLRSPFPLEVVDPLCGLDPRAAFPGRRIEGHRRWLWHLGPDQTHVMEAFRVLPAGPAGEDPARAFGCDQM